MGSYECTCKEGYNFSMGNEEKCQGNKKCKHARSRVYRSPWQDWIKYINFDYRYRYRWMYVHSLPYKCYLYKHTWIIYLWMWSWVCRGWIYLPTWRYNIIVYTLSFWQCRDTCKHLNEIIDPTIGGLPPISNSQREIIIISSTVGGVIFLLLIVIVVMMIGICYYVSGAPKKRDLYVVIQRLISLIRPLFSFLSPSLFLLSVIIINAWILQCWSQFSKRSKQVWWM